jgi:hypothetical protein
MQLINRSASRKTQRLAWKQKAHYRVHRDSRTQRQMIVKLQAFLASSVDGREWSVFWLVNILGSFPLKVGANVLLINKHTVNHKEQVYQQLSSEIPMPYISTYTRSENTFWSHQTYYLRDFIMLSTIETYDTKLIFGKTKLSNTWKQPENHGFWSFYSLKRTHCPTQFP